jgi:hypothetical protein
MSPEIWSRRALEVAAVADLVMARASALNPELLLPLDPAEQARRLARDLSLIEAAADTSLVRTLLPCLARHAELPFRVQHGDLWAENVFLHAGRWWLIDFDESGEFHTPLHDRFHLLSAAPTEATRSAWYALRPGEAPDAWGRARMAVLRAEADRLGLDDALVGLSLIAYLVHMIGFRLRPPMQGLFTSSLLGKLSRVSAYLADGGSLARLVPLH